MQSVEPRWIKGSEYIPVIDTHFSIAVIQDPIDLVIATVKSIDIVEIDTTELRDMHPKANRETSQNDVILLCAVYVFL